MPAILLHEVGLRDGLQMEHETVPLERKLAWIQVLMDAGMDVIQVGSFVHPTKVPQMADTDRLFQALAQPGARHSGALLSALVLNEKGLERGAACGVEMYCMGVSASETHSRKNTGMPIAEATERIIAMAKEASASARVQVSVQSAFGCGYEGAVPQERVFGIVRRFLDAGLKNISMADTAGHATPDQVERMFTTVHGFGPGIECACHFHNTYGLALANAYAALKAGVVSVETSVAGLGGCPFTKIAGGNLCTEDFVHYLHREGRRTEIRLEPLIGLAADVAAFFGRELPGAVYKAGAIPHPVACP
jgi:hydroxymethylglutaryl-CoA lyase